MSHPMRARQFGVTLVVTLLVLIVVTLLGIATAHVAIQGEKLSRNDRDHQIAFQAAEAALMDAEADIEQSPDQKKSRSFLFAPDSAAGFSGAADSECSAGLANPHLGLCRPATSGALPVWQTVDFLDDSNDKAVAIPYGKFTGRIFQTGAGSLPVRLPRYIIELIPFKKAGESAEKPGYSYRITAVGFGARETSQVALQTYYRKAAQ